MGVYEHKIRFARTHDGLATRSLAFALAVVLTALHADAQPNAAPIAEQQAPNVEQDASNGADSATDPRPFQDLDAADILNLNQRWTGDYDDLAERRFLRVLVPYSRTLSTWTAPCREALPTKLYASSSPSCRPSPSRACGRRS
jgi:hypothetical protein